MTTAYIGMGANLPSRAGAPAATLTAAAKSLERLGRVAARSRLYSTAPVGCTAQPRFVNAVVALETELAPRTLLEALLEIEREFGRERSAEGANGPRTLDLDLLLYGEARIDEPELTIPHPRLAERRFVLVPLKEIAAEAVEPRSGRTVAELMQRCLPPPDDDNQAVVPIESEVWRSGCGRNGHASDDGTGVRADGAADRDHG